MKIKITAGFLILALFIFTADSFAGTARFDLVDNYPALELWSPVSEDIDLAGKNILQFKWRQVDQTKTDHYEFKLYKGYATSDNDLIVKQDVRRDGYPIELPVTNFEINQVYTWYLRQIYIDGAKSDWAFSSFMITRK